MSFTKGQLDVATIALQAIAPFGFSLGGGHALSLHGFGDRPSLDLDFYVNQSILKESTYPFPEAEEALLLEMKKHNYDVLILRTNDWLRSFKVQIPMSDESILIDLAPLPQKHASVTAGNVQRVIHPADAVENKVRALVKRKFPRDYLDTYEILLSGQWTLNQLFEAAKEEEFHLTVMQFADIFDAVRRIKKRELRPYGVSEDAYEQMASQFEQWAEDIRFGK